MSTTTQGTRRLATIAILSALSFVLMLFSFPIIPGVDFLKMDFSIVPILVGLILYGIRDASCILLIRTLLKFLLNNRGITDVIGLPMNVIAMFIFILAFALIWKNKQTLTRYIQAAILGTFGLTIVMVILNLIYAIPLYVTFMNYDPTFLSLNAYIIPAVIPFNLIQGMIFSLVFYFAYLGLKPLLENI